MARLNSEAVELGALRTAAESELTIICGKSVLVGVVLMGVAAVFDLTVTVLLFTGVVVFAFLLTGLVFIEAVIGLDFVEAVFVFLDEVFVVFEFVYLLAVELVFFFGVGVALVFAVVFWLDFALLFGVGVAFAVAFFFGVGVAFFFGVAVAFNLFLIWALRALPTKLSAKKATTTTKIPIF